MKKNCPLIIAILFVLTIQAQNPIPNSSFENWSSGKPVGWGQSSSSIQQSNYAHSGNSSVQGAIGGFYNSYLILDSGGVVLNTRPKFLNFYTSLPNLHPTQGMTFFGEFFKDSTSIGTVTSQIFAEDYSNTPAYFPVSAEVNYTTNDVPNRFELVMESMYASTIAGSFYIDDVSLDTTPYCSSHFTLYPDVANQHHWYVLMQTTGIAPINYFWQWGDGDTTSLANPTHTYAAPGHYNICLSIRDSAYCQTYYCDTSTNIYKVEDMVTVTVVNQLPTGIQSAITNPQFAIFPNPSTNQLNITIDESMIGAQLNIYNLTGGLISTKQLQTINNKQETGNFPTGVYIAEVKTPTGSQRVRWVKM